ncbi:plasmid replication initiator TrfA [Magnetofaba australis]|nr:plasmid replication initiator TrfA [Magnetofaba australis]
MARRDQALSKTGEGDQLTLALPYWPDTDRAAPRPFLLSGLFPVVKRGTRRRLESEEVAVWGDHILRVTGQQMDQGDLDTLLELLHRARSQETTAPVETSARELLRCMGKKTGGTQCTWLGQSIERLQNNSIQITSNGRATYQGSLIQEFLRDEKTQAYKIVLNPRLAEMFGGGNYTRMIQEVRQALKTDLSKWLYGYVNSHRATLENPHRVKLSTLKPLTGSRATDKKFREMLRAGLEQLKEQGVLADWEITAQGVVVLTRPERAVVPETPRLGYGP